MLLEIIFISLPSEVFLCVERTPRVPILFESKEISQALSSPQHMVELSEKAGGGGWGFRLVLASYELSFRYVFLSNRHPSGEGWQHLWACS